RHPHRRRRGLGDLAPAPRRPTDPGPTGPSREADQMIPAASVRTRVRVPLTFGASTTEAEMITFNGLVDGREHLALRLGDPHPARRPLVRLHSECLTGDVFGSARCDCGPQLGEA